MIIDTGSEKYPIRYGMNALAMFGDLTDKPMNVVMDNLQDLTKLKISEVLAFVYVGFVDGARKAGEECKLKGPEEVGDMIDEDPELLSKAIQAYADDSMTDDPVEEGDKKK